MDRVWVLTMFQYIIYLFRISITLSHYKNVVVTCKSIAFLYLYSMYNIQEGSFGDVN